MTGDPKVQLLLPSTYTVVITLLTGLLHYPPSLPLLRLHNFCVICNRNLTGNISLTWTANFSWRIIGYGQHVQQGVKGGGGDDYNVCLNSRSICTEFNTLNNWLCPANDGIIITPGYCCQWSSGQVQQSYCQYIYRLINKSCWCDYGQDRRNCPVIGIGIRIIGPIIVTCEC